MKSKLFLAIAFCFLFFSNTIYGQQAESISTLTILGNNKYSDRPIGYGIEILFLEDKTKCDPAVGFRTLEEQEYQFEEYIKDFGWSRKDFKEIKEDLLMGAPNKKLKFTSTDFSEILKLMLLCEQNKFEVSKTFYLFKPHNFENEDVRAIGALEDAIEKAAVISKIVGKKITKILNIDDDTTNASIFKKQSDFNTEQYELLLEMLQSFGSESRFENERVSHKQSGAYRLRVTFQIEN